MIKRIAQERNSIVVGPPLQRIISARFNHFLGQILRSFAQQRSLNPRISTP